jgi:hypothetical protein
MKIVGGRDRGGTVTGVDAVDRAIDSSRRRAEEARVEVDSVVGDVSGGGFSEPERS